MTTTAKIEELQKSVINAINNSCLHPVGGRRVRRNVIARGEASEREVKKKEKKATRGQHIPFPLPATLRRWLA